MQRLGRAAEAAVLEQPREQLLDRLLRLEVEALHLLARQHQARLQLQQRGDQDQELGRRLEVELAARLEALDVGEHDLGEVDLEQVDLLVQDQRDEQVERPLEDVEIEMNRPSVAKATDGSVQAPASRLHRPAGSPSLTAPSPPWRCSMIGTAISRARSAPSLEHPLELAAVGERLLAALAERPQVLDDPLGDLVLVLAAAELAASGRCDRSPRRARPACRTASRS